MASKQSERIKLWGIVQGVGFRPYVAKAAARLDMKGQVLNIGGLVEITVTDTPKRISDFIEYLISNKPVPAEIVHIKREPVSYRDFDTFTIIKSDTGDDEAAMLPADLAICPDCLRELYTPGDPRYQHPFISCMICGPRYTIIDSIPYDRENTSMVDFPMCDFCESQYTELEDRRYHAQTISCHECGPRLLWKGAHGGDLEAYGTSGCFGADSANGADAYDADNDILDHAAEILRNGGVIAFKSVGGYNLVADPLNDSAVAKLRDIKKRESKPFAVMFRSLAQIKEFCYVNEAEERLLTSSARPIILLEHKELPYNEINRSRFIGSFLPSFAAQYMLLDRISPLIFTSANLSDMPMIKDEEDMFSMMEREPDIDGVIYNKRLILVRADDSVVRVIDGQPQMIRRSKGYAPVPLYIDMPEKGQSGSGKIPCSSDAETGYINPEEYSNKTADPKIDCKPQHNDRLSILASEPACGIKDYNDTLSATAPKSTAPVPDEKLMIMATGSQLKNSFALTKGPFTYISQFFGDMDTIENQKLYEENVKRLESLFRTTPNAVVCDMHPLYFTTSFGEKYAEENHLPLIRTQHHHAHVASVMAENDLKGKVIGVSFDGTGYGTDGCIWGGEFFICEGGNAQRIAHLKYVDMIGGDSSVKDAFRSAMSYIHAFDNGYCDDITACSKTPEEISVDISDIVEFGRQRLLERPDAKLVNAALHSGINTVKSSSMGRLFDAVSALLGIKEYNGYEGQCAIMLEDAAAFARKNPGRSRKCDLALDFHRRITDMIVEQCLIARDRYKTHQVALTGGTFQNKILMEGVLKKLRDNGFEPYYNISVSPNDGGIALGQVYIAMHRLAESRKTQR